jgi:hypothetical protein
VICPHCEKAFPLTWSRYFRAPTGRHSCPSCGGRFRLRYTTNYIASIAGPMAIATLVPIGIAHYLRAPILAQFAILAIFAFGVGFPLDRWIDDHRRDAIPLPSARE